MFIASDPKLLKLNFRVGTAGFPASGGLPGPAGGGGRGLPLDHSGRPGLAGSHQRAATVTAGDGGGEAQVAVEVGGPSYFTGMGSSSSAAIISGRRQTALPVRSAK